MRKRPTTTQQAMMCVKFFAVEMWHLELQTTTQALESGRTKFKAPPILSSFAYVMRQQGCMSSLLSYKRSINHNRTLCDAMISLAHHCYIAKTLDFLESEGYRNRQTQIKNTTQISIAIAWQIWLKALTHGILYISNLVTKPCPSCLFQHL